MKNRTTLTLKRTFLVLMLVSVTTSYEAFASSNSVLPFGKKKIELSVSEQDANIIVDGKVLGKGSLTLVVPKNSCINVKVEKVGFLRYEVEFCNRKDLSKPPKKHFVELQRDDAYNASVRTDIANVDIEIKTKKNKDAAWKLLNQIVLSYSDVIEITDKETGYIRTAWQLKTFRQNTIRTRIIVKQSGDDPLAFKLKLISEESRRALTSVKSDELYREWDRVLRKYKDFISEAQSRMQ